MAAEANINVNVNVDKAEDSLRTFQGSIDVLGGAVEATVGGLALLGTENKWVENLEQGALGAIAFADGIKRFSEGAITLAKNTQLASKAQAAFNVVANLNPYILGVTALVAAGAAIFGIAKALSSVEDETKNVNIAYTNLIPNLESAKTAYDNLKTSIDAVFASEQQNAIDAATSSINKNIDANVTALTELETALQTITERRNIQIAGAAKFNEQFTSQYLQSLSLFDLERDKKIAEGRRKGDEARAIDFEIQRRQLNTQIAQTTKIIEDGEKARLKVTSEINAEIAAARQEEFIANQQQIETEQVKILEAATIQNEALIDRTIILPQLNQQVLDAVEDIRGLSTKQVDAITNSTDLLEAGLERFGESAATTFEFVGNLNTIFTKDEEENAKRAFNISKASNLSRAIIETALSVQKAFTSQLIPGDPTSVVRAVGASILAGSTGAAQIATIARTKYETAGGGGGGNPGATGGGGTTFQATAFQGNGINVPEDIDRQSALFFGNGQQPIQAYVVAGDVQNGLEANKQLSLRRTL